MITLGALAILYVCIGAEVAAYLKGWDEGVHVGRVHREPWRWYELALIAALWPAVMVAGLWRDHVASKAEDED